MGCYDFFKDAATRTDFKSKIKCLKGKIEAGSEVNLGKLPDGRRESLGLAGGAVPKERFLPINPADSISLEKPYFPNYCQYP